MQYSAGDVWWGPAIHKSAPSYRPWVIISNDTHPFHHTECVAMAITTQAHSAGVEIRAEDWIRGGSKTDSYISPWYVLTMKYCDFDRQQGTLRKGLLETATDELTTYVFGVDQR